MPGFAYRFRIGFFIAALFLSGCSLVSVEEGEVATYTVRSGDTIYDLSQKFQVPVEDIIALNDLQDPDHIDVGKILRIPRRPIDHIGATSSWFVPRNEQGHQTVELTNAKEYLGKLSWPLSRCEVASRFGKRFSSFHEGMDLLAPSGTPIYAAHDGTVVFSGRGFRNYGKMIVIRGEHGIFTLYAHNDHNSVDVGDTVAQGDVIGEVGATGNASGPHCHFEVRVRNQKGKLVAVNPEPFLAASRGTMQRASLAE